jgi:hypothetical protein
MIVPHIHRKCNNFLKFSWEEHDAMAFTDQQAAEAAKALGADFATARYPLVDSLGALWSFEISNLWPRSGNKKREFWVVGCRCNPRWELCNNNLHIPVCLFATLHRHANLLVTKTSGVFVPCILAKILRMFCATYYCTAPIIRRGGDLVKERCECALGFDSFARGHARTGESLV